MQTFPDHYQALQKKTGDFSATRLATFKTDLNEGATQFMNRLGRKVNREYITSSLKSNRQYYQMPYGCLRVYTLRVKVGSSWYTPDPVFSEDQWNDLNANNNTSTIPLYYFIRGFNEIGLWPIPSLDNTNAMEVSYDPAHIDLTADDYIVGKVTVTNGQVTVVGIGTTFTDTMVGRWIQLTNDGKSYRISGFIDATHLSLENYYEGDTVAAPGSNYRIGEVFKIPKGYQKAPQHYAMEQYYLEKEDDRMTALYSGYFERLIKEAKSTYGTSTGRMGVKTRITSRKGRGWIDNQPPVSYP
jgi:hypothetical protein